MSEQKGVQRSLQGATLVDLLDRILDKGLVVAGDIVVQLADVELLTIKIRLLVCSVDKAEEIGMDWWRHDTFLSSNNQSALKKGTPKLFSTGSKSASEREKRKPESAIASKSIGKVMRDKRRATKGGSQPKADVPPNHTSGRKKAKNKR
jgi:hypothetical protein